jgi:hypothetical protein
MAGIELRDEREPGYFTIDNELIDDYALEVGVYGVAVYNVLCRFASQSVAFPSLETIAAKLGISRTTVKKALTALEKAKVIHIRHRPGDPANGIPPKSSVYSIRKIKKVGGRPPDDLPQEMAYGVDHDVTGGRPYGGGGVGHDVAPNNPSLNKKGGVAKPSQTTPPPVLASQVAQALLNIGLTENQTRLALAQRAITMEEVERIRTWLKSCTAHKPMGVLWMRLKVGMLPDDLPPPPRQKLPDIEWEELPNGTVRPKNPADYARILGSSISTPGGCS